MSKLSKITLLLLKIGTMPISQFNISSDDRTSLEDLNYINIWKFFICMEAKLKKIESEIVQFYPLFQSKTGNLGV